MAIESNPTCLCIEVRGAAQQLTRAYDLALAPAGITVTQFSQLHSINSLESPTLKMLAEETQLDRSTLGRNMHLLDSMGLVKIQAGRDARTKTVQLTPKGMTAYKNAGPLWYAIQSKTTAKLGKIKHQLLKELLAELSHTSQ